MKIGIIGYGNMGSAIAGRIKNRYKVFVFDKDKEKTNKATGINVAKNISDLIKNSDVIVLAVKPQDFDSVLGQIKNYIKKNLVVSIAAGITTAHIEKLLGKAKVVRTMPNLPAKIGDGMICLSKGRFVKREDLALAQTLFSCLGKTMVLDEKLMDAATAVSGSGPGFIYSIIGDKIGRTIKTEEFIQDFLNREFGFAAKKVGFNQRQAKILAETTVKGSLHFWIESGLSPKELEIRVASKGGTTEAGLKVLRRTGSLGAAVKAAAKRAKELSKS